MPTVKSILLFFVCGIAVLFSQRAEAWLSCSIEDRAPPYLDFGVINESYPYGMQTEHTAEASQTMRISCSAGPRRTHRFKFVNVCLYIGDGTGGSSFNPRYLKHETKNEYMGFQIYKDSGRQNEWGANAYGTPHLVSFQLNRRARGSQDFTLFGKTSFKLGSNYHNAYYWVSDGFYSSDFDGIHTEWKAGITDQQITDPSWCSAGSFNIQSQKFPFSVWAEVAKKCKITSSTIDDLNFGTVASLSSTSPTSATNLRVQCTPDTPYRIGLDNGLYASGTQRRMRRMLLPNNDYVAYYLYKDVNHSQPWGNDFGADTIADGGNTKSGTGTGLPQTHTIFGKVPTPQSPVGGDYKDTVTITVRY